MAKNKNITLPIRAALLGGGACLLSLAWPQPVIAQPTDSAAVAAGDIQEIVVTARRRDEALQSVPIAISAFSGADLEQKSIQTAFDLQRFVPSLQDSYLTNRDADQLSIRSIPGVIAYFAEAPVVSAVSAAGGGPTSAAGPALYYDLSDIEVLKGPQGTLFGGTTTGGAVLFQPKKPAEDFEGYAEITLGNYNDHEFEGAVNVPVVPDKLLVRVAGQTQQRDGYTHDVIHNKDLDNRDYYAARIGVTFLPTDKIENYFVYSSFFSDNNGTGEEITAVNPTGFAALAFGNAASGALALQQRIGPRATALDTPEIGKEYTFRFTDVARWDLTDELAVRNIAAYTESKYLSRWDLDGSELPIIGSVTPYNWSLDLGAASEELQLQGKPLDGNLNWTTGAFLQFVHPIGYSSIAENEFNFPGSPIASPLTAAARSISREHAIYVQASYNLGNLLTMLDGWNFTGGYRYSWDYASNLTNSYDAQGNCQGVSGRVPNCGSAISGNFNQGTWTLSVDRKLAAHSFVYAIARRGYNPGGFNSNAPSPDLRTIQPEHLTDVEIGVKSDWTVFGIQGRTNLDAYHDDYTDIQRMVGVVAGTIGSLTENAAAATLEGIEFEGTLVPIKRLELSGMYSYANGKYDQYQSPTQGDLSGLPFTGVSRTKYSFTSRYHVPINAGFGDLSLSATYNWQSHFQFSDREPGGVVPARGLLDVRVDWNDIAARPFDASFYMTNATDQLYIAGGTVVYNALGVNPILYGEPRMFGVKLRYRFGPLVR